MTATVDLGPAAHGVATVAGAVTDDDLDRPTPCPEYAVRDLVAHLLGLSLAFRDAGAKAGASTQDSAPGPAPLEDAWRALLPERLTALVAAWRSPDAWEGTTRAGGVDMPAAILGKVAVNELVIHGWDLARATGQEFTGDPASVEAALDFVSATVEPSGAAARQGIFGPIVEIEPTAPQLDRLLGLSGRDPGWAPPGRTR